MRLPPDRKSEPEVTGWATRTTVIVVKVILCGVGAIVLLYFLYFWLWPV